MSSSPLSIEERRRRRDQRLAVETANQIVQDAANRGRTITREWALITVLLALGIALVAASIRRGPDPKVIGCAAWAGLILGGVLCHAALQSGRRGRLTALGATLFSGLPLAVIPFSFFRPHRADLALLAVSLVGGAVFGGAARSAYQLRDTLPELRGAATASAARAGAAFSRWLHDAVLKWIAAIFLIVAGAACVYFSRQADQPRLFWIGATLIFLVGSVGLWMPGLYSRTRLPVAIRHCGQLCFWLSLLAVPFAEQGPGAALPYPGRPSWRVFAMGIGLVIIGATWTLQRTSIFSHHSKPEGKGGPETTVALLIVVVGLIVTLLGADLRERTRFVVDSNNVSETNLAGSLHFEPNEQIQSLVIVQPIEYLPFFIEEVRFTDGNSYRTLPALFAGDPLHPDANQLTLAVRSAGGLNSQSFPQSRTEVWSK